MIILRQKMQSKPDQSDELMAGLAEIIAPARATRGVISFDIARVLLEPHSFIATAIYEDGAALERQESAPEVHRAMAMFPGWRPRQSERFTTHRATQPSSKGDDRCRKRRQRDPLVFVELDTRHADGFTVSLEWDRDTGQTQIVVSDVRSAVETVVSVPRAKAADAFRHPFRYAP
jgi:quinol monooxygenase YgiN